MRTDFRTNFESLPIKKACSSIDVIARSPTVFPRVNPVTSKAPVNDNAAKDNNWTHSHDASNQRKYQPNLSTIQKNY
jgi:hypothetical protein